MDLSGGFKAGDRFTYTGKNAINTPKYIGKTGVVTEADEYGVKVIFDDGGESGYFVGQNLEPLREDQADTDTFINIWAGKLEEFADSETRVAPYSYVGFIASMLMDYTRATEATNES